MANTRKRTITVTPTENLETPEVVPSEGQEVTPEVVPSEGQGEVVSIAESLQESATEQPQINGVGDNVSVEEMLRQARAATKQQKQEEPKNDCRQQQQAPPPPEGEGEGEQPEDPNVSLALKEAANKLIKAEQKAKLARLQSGVELGVQDIRDIEQGRQIGQLLALAEVTDRNSTEMVQQFQKLRQHTDKQTAKVVEAALTGMGFELKELPPGEEQEEEELDPLLGEKLAQTVKRLLPSRSQTPSFSIFNQPAQLPASATSR